MSKITIIEGNSNNKNNVRAIMVKGEKGEQGDLNHNDIIDNLTSTATDKVLSAKQGKILKDLIDENENNIEENYATKAELNAEATTRANADTNLQSQISGLASGSPLVASSTSGMTDTAKTYVNTTDGNWYYYNGSQWTIGGVYQSTGIADNSIGLAQLKDEVINDRYENITDNKFNPFEAQNNKATSSATGVISDNTTYWLSNKVYLNSGDRLDTFSKSSLGNYCYHKGFYRICAYQLDGTFIEAKGSDYKYVAAQDCYVIIQYHKENNLDYGDRFKLCYIIFNTTNPYIVDYAYPFKTYTGSKKANINLGVNYDDFSKEIKRKLPIIDNYTFQIGSLNSETGIPTNKTSRIRTIDYLYFPKGSQIKTLTNDILIDFVEYDDDYFTHFVGSTGFISNYTFNENKFGKVVCRYTDSRQITDENLNYIIQNVEILAPVDYILDYIDENTKVGTQLTYSGEKINLYNKCYVSSNIGIPTRTQDGCIYNGINFEFGTDGTFTVTDMENLTVYGTFDLDQKATILPHCNSACFGNEFYDVNDEFPLLYINAYNNTALPKGTCYVHRIQRDENNVFTTTLVQTISIGFTGNELWEDNADTRPYGNFAVDIDHNYLYVFVMRTGLKVTRFFKFRLPKLSDGTSIILAQSDILDYFDAPYEPYIQGCQYYQNKIYSSCGINSVVANSSSIRVIDLVSKGEIANIPTSSITAEPETVAFYNNKMVFGGSQLLYIDF